MVKYEGYQDSNWGEIFYTFVDHKEKANWRRVIISGTPGAWQWVGTGDNRRKVWHEGSKDSYIVVDWKNFYQILELDQNEYWGKSVKPDPLYVWKDVPKADGSGYKRERVVEGEKNPIRTKVNKALRLAKIKANSKSDAEKDLINQATQIFTNDEAKKAYDKLLKEEVDRLTEDKIGHKGKMFILDSLRDNAAALVNNLRTSTYGNIYNHRYFLPGPYPDVNSFFLQRVSNELNAIHSRKEANRYGNRINDILMKLAVVIQTCRARRVDPATLGNFVADFFNLETKQEVTNFYEQLDSRINAAGNDPSSKKKSAGLEKLRNLPGWGSLTADEQNTFVNRIRNIKGLGTIDDEIREVIRAAEQLIKSKNNDEGGNQKKCAECFKSQPPNSALHGWDKVHGRLFCSDNCTNEYFRKLKQKYITQLRGLTDWNLLSTAEQDNFIDKINTDIPGNFDKIVADARQAIASKKGNGGWGKGAIREIEDALAEYGFTATELKWGDWKKYFVDNKYKSYLADSKNKYLNVIYRTKARRKISQKLVERSASINILGVGDLKAHFKGFSGKSAIEAERDRLLALIDSQRQDRLAEVETAITEIRQVLQTAGVGQKEEIALLGSAWETNYETSFRYETSANIKAEKERIINLINDFVARNSTDSQTIIAEIETMLRESGLNESILGVDWKSKLQGKNKNEREAEKNRLIKLIEAEIDRKKSTGDLSETEAVRQKKELASRSAASAKGQITSKLTEGHKKLAVAEAELADQLAPYKTVEEKLNSLASVEEIATFENNLLGVIDQKKKVKLNNIAGTAIADIKKELGGDSNIELGTHKDFENMIKNLVNPDEIESLKIKIVALIKEQKLAKSVEGTSDFSGEKQPNSPSWPKILGITALIALPLVTGAFIILRIRRLRWQRRRKIN